jgi:RNA polymerase sigma factor (sigma-70 family)
MLTAENRRDRDGNLAALENFRSHLPAEQIILFDRVRGPLVQRIRSRVDQQIKNIPDKEKKSQARDKKTNELLELSHTSLQEAFAQEYLQPLAKNREEFEARIDRVLNLTSRGITELETVDKTPAAIEVEPPQEIISRTKIPKPVAAPVAKIVSVPSELVSPVIESPVEKTANEQPQTLDQIVLEELSLRTPVAHKKILSRKRGDFEQYISEISRYPQLDFFEEQRWFKKLNELKSAIEKLKGSDSPLLGVAIQKHARLREYLVNCNLGLGIAIAERHMREGDDFFDLIQLANQGIVKAVDKFDLSFGWKFSTYAWESALNTIKQERLVLGRVSQPTVEVENRYYKALEIITKEKNDSGHTPSVEEVATRLDVSAESLKILLSLFSRSESLNAPASSVTGKSAEGAMDRQVGEIIKDSNHTQSSGLLIRKENSSRISNAFEKYFSKLTHPKGAEVLRLLFGIDKAKYGSLVDASKSLDVSDETIRRIRDKSLNELKIMIFLDSAPVTALERFILEAVHLKQNPQFRTLEQIASAQGMELSGIEEIETILLKRIKDFQFRF